MSGTITVHGQRHYGNEPFTKKNLSLQITLPPGLQKNNFRVAGAIESVVLPNGANQISLSGFAMNASVVALGMVDGVTMQVQVYNLPYDIMAMLAGYGNKGVFVFDSSDSAAGALAASILNCLPAREQQPPRNRMQTFAKRLHRACFTERC